MPQTIAAAAVAAGASKATAAAIATAVVTTAITTAISLGVSAYSQSRTKSLQKKAAYQNYIAKQEALANLPIQSAIDTHKIIYGKAKIAGTIVFRAFADTATIYPVAGGTLSDGNRNRYYHCVFALAGHEIEDIEKFYIDGEEVNVNGSGFVTDAKHIALIQSTNVYACQFTKYYGTTTQTADPTLTSEVSSLWTSNHRLRGIAYVAVKIITDHYGRIPDFSFLVKGKKVFDPRTSTTAWSDNWALCVRDYLTNSDYGLGVTSIDDTIVNAAANICDENVNILPSGTQKRYTLNAIIDTADSPLDNLDLMALAGAGVITYQQGQFKIYAGAYDIPSVTIDESWIVSDIQLVARRPRGELYNGVKGVYISADKDYAVTDFPSYVSSTYKTQDGNVESLMDLTLTGINDVQRTQRVARIALERHRRQEIIRITCNLKAMQLSVWDTIYLTITDLGYSSDVFRVLEWSRNPEGGIDLTLQPEDSNIYAWSSANAVVTDAPTISSLPDVTIVNAPTNLQLSSGTNNLFLRADGTIFSRIKVEWTAPSDLYVRFGQIEIQHKKSTASVWEKSAFVGGTETLHYILDVEDKTNYDVRIRSVNSRGLTSAWVTQTNYSVIGKTEPPANVSNFQVFVNGNNVVLSWSAVADIDLSGYELRYGPPTYNWEDLTILSRTTKLTNFTSAAVPPNTWKFAIKAVDNSGNFSLVETTKTAEVTSDFNIIELIENSPLWYRALYDYPYYLGDGSGKYWQNSSMSTSDPLQNPATATISDNISFRVSFNTGAAIDVNTRSVFSSGASITSLTTGCGLHRSGSSTNFVARVQDTTQQFSITLTTLPANTDVDLYFTFDGASFICYNANGTQIGIDTTATAITATAGTTFRIGQHTSSTSTGNNYNNAIYLFAFWDGVKTWEQMNLLDEDNLLHYYNFDEAGSSTLTDRGSLAKNLSAVNSAVVSSTLRQSYVNPYGVRFIRNPLRGVIRPKDNALANQNNFNVFDSYVQTPYINYRYTASELDLGSDIVARLWNAIDASLVDGTNGNLEISQLVDYRTGAGSYNGYEDTTGVGIQQARFVKYRLEMNGTKGLGYISDYDNIADQQEKTESGNATISIGGTTINFNLTYLQVPNVVATFQGSSSNAFFPVITNVTTSSFTAKVYNTSGTDVGGNIYYNVTGV